MEEKTRFEDLAIQCLFDAPIESKLDATSRARGALAAGVLDLSLHGDVPARSATDVCFPEKPILVEPRQLARRSLGTPAGLIAFLHAVAHIEFTAILLAWDMAYRFRGLPEQFMLDWLGVAIEEASHFSAVRDRLRSLGADYGDLPAHRGLWELAEQTSGDVLHRLALVPRFMEARGLDVTPGMIVKLTELGDLESTAILELILREEIGHVAMGTRWFKHFAEMRGLDAEEEYFGLIDRYIKGGVRGPFNVEARRRAGFSQGEMNRLESLGSTP